MGSLEGLYEALEPLRLYALHRDGLVDRELSAYGAGFSILEDAIRETWSQAFVQTAAGPQLDRHEKMVGLLPRGELDDETRRALVLYRMGYAPFDFNREGMLSSIRACGMEAEIAEDPENETVTVRCVDIIDKSLDLDRLKNVVRTVLPVHLEADFDTGELTWNMLEAAGADWTAWDAKNFTWNEFDLDGHTIFQ